MTLFIFAAVVSTIGVTAAYKAVRAHRRVTKQKNTEFHRALLHETEQRLSRLSAVAEPCNS